MKVEPGGGAPMPEQTRFDMFELERGFEQRIVLQIDLPDREVIRGAPIGVHLFQQIGRQRGRHQGLFTACSCTTPDGCKEVCSAPSTMFIADKIRATISRGRGSIETTIGFSSGPGSSSASNWL